MRKLDTFAMWFFRIPRAKITIVAEEVEGWESRPPVDCFS
jgi:hypothetical protein